MPEDVSSQQKLMSKGPPTDVQTERTGFAGALEIGRSSPLGLARVLHTGRSTSLGPSNWPLEPSRPCWGASIALLGRSDRSASLGRSNSPLEPTSALRGRSKWSLEAVRPCWLARAGSSNLLGGLSKPARPRGSGQGICSIDGALEPVSFTRAIDFAT